MKSFKPFQWHFVRHVPAHVVTLEFMGTRGERADEAAMRRAHRNRIQTRQRQDRLLEDMVNDIVNIMLVMYT